MFCVALMVPPMRTARGVSSIETLERIHAFANIRQRETTAKHSRPDSPNNDFITPLWKFGL